MKKRIQLVFKIIKNDKKADWIKDGKEHKNEKKIDSDFSGSRIDGYHRCGNVGKCNFKKIFLF